MPTPIEMLASFARFGREHRVSLRDPTSKDAFLASAGTALDEALRNDILLHGHRTQNMFEALLIALGEYTILKVEDAGRIYPADQYKVPDFRVMLKDGPRWLIEVKNVYEHNPADQNFQITEAYLTSLQAYAATMSHELKIALYWARWRLWTLIDPNQMRRQGDKLVISMGRAIQVSELASLGDRMVGTRPPLKLTLLADRAKPRSVSEEGEAQFTIGEAAIYCGDDEIVDAVEQEIAWIFMQYGDWIGSEPCAVMSGQELDAIEFQWEPRERLNEGFEPIGWLSSMFTRYYAEKTLSDSGIVQLEVEPTPAWFRPLVQLNPRDMKLPLWKLVIQPRTGCESDRE